MKVFYTKFLSFVIVTIFFAGFAYAEPKVNVIDHVTVFREEGRFGGWPANHGIWKWGDEILVGFSRGYYKDLGDRHHIDRERPEEHLFARSKDGGRTWSIEDPSSVIVPRGEGLQGIKPPPLIPPVPVPNTKPINFTHPDLALTFRMLDHHSGPSLFYYSYNRGHSWNGPFDLLVKGVKGIAARTDYCVNSSNDCMAFLTCAKNNGREGRPFCARTQDGGITWDHVAWIGPEPKEFSIMPSSIRLSETSIIVAVRRREGPRRWIEVYRSDDNGLNWRLFSTPAGDIGIGNPPSMIQLKDNRICLTYGYRAEPYSIRARLSSDDGKTWTKQFSLREDGASRDIGYPRTVQLPNGTILTVYYFCDRRSPERYIAATLWRVD